jgi:hypothetical protein
VNTAAGQEQPSGTAAHLQRPATSSEYELGS